MFSTVLATLLVGLITSNDFAQCEKLHFNVKVRHQCRPPCVGGPHDVCHKCTKYCERTCENPEPNRICKKLCTGGTCECEDGYIRNNDKQCILPDDCPAPSKCLEECRGGDHDKCVYCATACPATCKNPNAEAECDLPCKPKACQCERGYVRDENDICIKYNECPGLVTAIVSSTQKMRTTKFRHIVYLKPVIYENRRTEVDTAVEVTTESMASTEEFKPEPITPKPTKKKKEDKKKKKKKKEEEEDNGKPTSHSKIKFEEKLQTYLNKTFDYWVSYYHDRVSQSSGYEHDEYESYEHSSDGEEDTDESEDDYYSDDYSYDYSWLDNYFGLLRNWKI